MVGSGCWKLVGAGLGVVGELAEVGVSPGDGFLVLRSSDDCAEGLGEALVLVRLTQLLCDGFAESLLIAELRRENPELGC